jgi:hypothetical protein
LSGRRPDEYFAPEAKAAKGLGFEVCTIDHDALSAGDADGAVRRVPEIAGVAVYRGWMVRSEQYGLLAAALSTRGVTLRTSATAYRAAHELPGWYEAFRAHTAPSVWLDGPGTDGLLDDVAKLPPGPALVKDWVKSMKHYWDEAAFIPDVRDSAGVLRVAGRFLELRGEDLVGGLVVRSFEQYQPGEVRSWWVDGQCAVRSAHPDTPELEPPEDVDVSQLAGAVASVRSPFVVVDLAQTTEGQWRVVELGDGQVSDRPTSLPAEDLLRLLGPVES